MSHFEKTYSRRPSLIRRSVTSLRGSRTKFAYHGVHFAEPGRPGNSREIIDLRDEPVADVTQHPYFWTRMQVSSPSPVPEYVRSDRPLRMRAAQPLLVDDQRRVFDQPSN